MRPRTRRGARCRRRLTSRSSALPLNSSKLNLICSLGKARRVMDVIISSFTPISSAFSYLCRTINRQSTIRSVFPSFFQRHLIMYSVFRRVVISVTELRCQLIRVEKTVISSGLVHHLSYGGVTAMVKIHCTTHRRISTKVFLLLRFVRILNEGSAVPM